MNIKEIVANNFISWIIEGGILIIVAAITINEVRETNEQTREMLTAISDFAAQYEGQAGEAVENVLHEVATVDVEGDITIEDAKEVAIEWLKKDDSE